MEPQTTPQPEDDVVSSAARLGGRSPVGLAAVVPGAVPFLALLGLVQAVRMPLAELPSDVAGGLDATVAASPLAVRVLSIASEAGGGATASFLPTVAVVCLLVRRRHGHAAAATVVHGGIALVVVASTRARWRWAVAAPAVVVVLATGAGRVDVAAHRPSDVVAGILLGVLRLAVLYRVLEMGAPGRDQPRGTPTSPVASRSRREVSV